jgi:hypothetical protein
MATAVRWKGLKPAAPRTASTSRRRVEEEEEEEEAGGTGMDLSHP